MAEAAGLIAGPVLDAVVILPPPATGQTLVTERLCAAFAAAGPFNLRAVSNHAGLVGWRWTLAKHGRYARALAAAALTSRGRHRAYFVPDAAGGLWFNLVEAVLLRLGFREVWLHHHVFSYVRRRDWRMAAILRLLGPRARHIVLGPAMAEGLAAQYGATQAVVLGNTPFVADIPAGRPRSVLRAVGFLGNITRDKGIGLFMETLRDLQDRGHALEAVIAGPVADPTLRAEIDAFVAEAPDHRFALGAVRGADKQAFFDRIDVLLFPSRYANEALPVTIYEALAAGVPVLATGRGCIPDQLEGLGWALPEERFADRAAETLAAWLADPGAFAAASGAALARFAEQQRTDTAALDGLIAEVTRP